MSARGVVLTRQQKRAMLAFLWRDGFDDEACDDAVWDWGVRPWPTMDNIAKKGLIEAREWWGADNGGWNWRLTGAGREYMRKVVADLAASAAHPTPPETLSAGVGDGHE